MIAPRQAAVVAPGIWSRRVLEAYEVSLKDRTILLCMALMDARRAGEVYHVAPRIKAICEIAESTHDDVTGLLNILQEAGYLQSVAKPGERSRYVLTLPGDPLPEVAA